jgi:hypothetical protein
MLIFDQVHFQLVDLPAVSPEHPVPWLAGALQMADACLLVVDLGDPDCVGEVEAVRGLLGEKRVTLTERWPGDSATVETDDDPFAIRLPTLLVANKADLSADENAELETFRELTGLRYPALGGQRRPERVSARSGPGSSATSASCAFTPRRRASRPRKTTPSRSAAAKPWRTSRASSTRTLHSPSSTRACGASRASTASTSGASTSSRTAT